MPNNQPHVLIVGGSYGGLAALNTLISLSSGQSPSQGPSGNASRGLRSKPRYTLLDERDGFYHTVGAPLGQISLSWAREFWVPFEEIVRARTADGEEDVRFIQGSVRRLDMHAKKLGYVKTDGAEAHVEYDCLVLATGMRRAAPIVPQKLDRGGYLKEVANIENELSQCKKVVLVGGGAVGIELAAEIKTVFPKCQVILVHSRSDLLNAEPLPDEFKARALEITREEGVEVVLGQRVTHEEANPAGRTVQLSNGERITCDKVIYTAVQRGANTGFLASDALDEKGCVQARDTLQFPSTLPNADDHFAVGDILSWSGIKRSGPAQAMGKLAASNIITSLVAIEDGITKPVKLAGFSVGKPTMSLAVGRQAVTIRDGVRWGREILHRAFGAGLGIDGTLAKLQLRPRLTLSEPVSGVTPAVATRKVEVTAHI